MNEICNNDDFSLLSSSFNISMNESNNIYSNNLINQNYTNLSFSLNGDLQKQNGKNNNNNTNNYESFNEINVYYPEKKDNSLEEYYENFYT